MKKPRPMRKQPRPPRTKEQVSADMKVLQEKLGRTKQPRPKPKPKPKPEPMNQYFDNKVPPEKPQGPIRTDLENKLLLEKLEEMMSTPQKRAWLMPAAFCQYASRGKWVIAPHLQLLNQYLMAVAGGQLKRLIINLPPRHGKALALNTPIPTPDGYKLIQHLRPWVDKVFDETGNICTVVAKSQVWKNRQTYKVTTNDGTVIIADGEHEWLVSLDPATSPYKLYTTEYLASRTFNRGHAFVMKPKPLELPEQNLPIDPYYLGLWLGDGSSHEAAITAHPDDQVFYREELTRLGFILSTHISEDIYRLSVLEIKIKLKELGVLENKHIPEIYLRASKTQRLHLLQGLIDSDGYVSRKDGEVEFTSKLRFLGEQVQELVHTFGINCTLTQRKCGYRNPEGQYIDTGTYYSVLFYMKDCARLPRKRQYTRDSTVRPNYTLKFELHNIQDTICIEVNSKSHLFLAGNGMIPTHNSEMVSKYFPVWFLGRYPDKNVLFASYESDFAASWGQKARDCMQEHGREIFNLSVHPTVASASRWGLNHRTGEMKTAGAGAGLTGKGADLMIIDDIIKGAETALSKTQRDKIWSWYQSECFTRLEPGGSIILIQTRWNADDLTGRVLEQAKITGEDWFVLNLPAIAEENDILGRKVGEPLWPERYPLKELEKIQKSVGSYWWASLYQQRPSPAEGGILKKIWFRYYTRPPITFDEVILSCDLAFKDLKNSAYVVLQIWGRLGADKYLIAQVRAKMDFPTTVKAIRDICSQYPEAKVKLIEEAANGAAVISTLKHEISGIIPILAHGSKEARVHAISSQIEAGNVFLPELAYWVEDFVEECATFPNGLYMDQVDAMSQALFRLGDSRRVVLITPEGDLGKTSTFKAPTYDFDDVEQNPGEFKDDLKKVSQWKTIIPY